MAIHAVRRGGLSKPKRQESATTRIPAPYKGVDSRTPLAQGALDVCVYTYNLVPDDGGIKLRKGYREWQIEVEAATGISVNTIMPFDGLAEDGSEDRLFAVTNEGIFDVTASAGTPTNKVTFTTQTEDAGFGVYISYITDAGDKIMMYADSLNGLFTYDVTGDTWAQATGITGVTVTDINFVALHKQRIWFIERNSPDSYYLGLGAIAGAATKFSFGPKFKSGGSLRGLFNWSVDGGAGVDDMFVGVSSAGDVAVYQGDDPSSATTWELRGIYFIGNLPKGPKFATDVGGELYLLSTYGLISMGDLLKGTSITNPDDIQASFRVAGIIRGLMAADSTLNGWSVRYIPSEGGILITTPVKEGVRPLQLFYNTTVDGWGFWRDLAIRSFATWKNAVVFGDASMRVNYMDVEVDDVKITPPPAPTVNATPIEFSVLSSFSPLGLQGINKVVQYIRPDTIGVIEPTFSAVARYDYTSLESTTPVASAPPKIGIWDVDNWDGAVWGADINSGWNTIYGSSGIGRNAAVAYRGQAYNTFTLVGWDVIYKAGGPMI